MPVCFRFVMLMDNESWLIDIHKCISLFVGKPTHTFSSVFLTYLYFTYLTFTPLCYVASCFFSTVLIHKGTQLSPDWNRMNLIGKKNCNGFILVVKMHQELLIVNVGWNDGYLYLSCFLAFLDMRIIVFWPISSHCLNACPCNIPWTGFVCRFSSMGNRKLWFLSLSLMYFFSSSVHARATSPGRVLYEVKPIGFSAWGTTSCGSPLSLHNCLISSWTASYTELSMSSTPSKLTRGLYPFQDQE